MSEISAAAASAREAARQPNGEFGHQVNAEAPATDLIGEQGFDPAAHVGQCPDCGAPMSGHIGKGRYLPGSSCIECGHHVAQHEVTSEPDDEGDAYTYVFDRDGFITLRDSDGSSIESWAPGSYGWESAAGVVGLSGQARAVHLAAFCGTNPGEVVRKAVEEADLPVMAGIYDVVLDRDEIPVTYVMDQLHLDDIEGHYSMSVSPAITDLGDEYVHARRKRSGDDRPGAYPSTGDLKHVDRVCNEAGLPAMAPVYRILADRGDFDASAVHDLTHDTVEADYEAHIGPAVDSMCDRMSRDYRFERAEQILDHSRQSVESAEWRKDDRLVEAYTSFLNSDGGRYDLGSLQIAFEERGHHDIAARLTRANDAVR